MSEGYGSLFASAQDISCWASFPVWAQVHVPHLIGLMVSIKFVRRTSSHIVAEAEVRIPMGDGSIIPCPTVRSALMRAMICVTRLLAIPGIKLTGTPGITRQVITITTASFPTLCHYSTLGRLFRAQGATRASRPQPSRDAVSA